MSSVLAELSARTGKVERSDWLVVDQAMIDGFAAVTRDKQFIHVDPAKAAATPFGGTVAHGLLLLSLLPHLQASTSSPVPAGMQMGVNYGFDRVRFISPVRAGNRIRIASTIKTATERSETVLQVVHDVLVEIEGQAKPALQAEWISQLFFQT